MVTPGVSVGTRRWLSAPSGPSPVRQRTTIRSEMEALVIHILLPSMIHESPSGVALVRTPPFRSDPAPGSVRLRQASLPWPLVSRGSQARFCASLP